MSAGIRVRDKTATSAVRAIAWHGGLVAAAGGMAFLICLGLMQLIRVPVFKFLFLGVSLNKPALSFFLLVSGLFTLVCGGVAGNLAGKRNAVPVVRLLGGLIGVVVWVGFVMALKPGSQTVAAWLSGSPLGMFVGASGFLLTALFIGLAESFGDDLDFRLTGYDAVGGVAAGAVAGLVGTLAFTAVSMFGQDMPTGWAAIGAFSLKVALIVAIIGFTAGLSFWFAIGTAERYAQ